MKQLLWIGKFKSNKNEEQLFFIILHAHEANKTPFYSPLLRGDMGVWGCGEGGNGDCEGWAIMLELH